MNLSGDTQVDITSNRYRVLSAVLKRQRAPFDNTKGITFVRVLREMLVLVPRVQQFQISKPGYTAELRFRRWQCGLFDLASLPPAKVTLHHKHGYL